MAFPTKYSYSSAKAHKFSLAMVRSILDRYLSNQGNNLYPQVERLLTEPGSTGRVSWDQCMAVQLVLKVDADEGVTTGPATREAWGTGELTAMVATGQLTMPTIGAELYKVLKKANFIIERGRITGVTETTDAA